MQQKLPHWLNTKDMAKSLGISPQAFDKWGVPSAAKIGRETFYTVDDVLQNRLAHQQERLNRENQKFEGEGPSPAEMDQELLLLRREQRVKLELENAQTRRELAPVQVLDWVLSKIGGEIASILESVPPKLKKLNPKLTAADIELIVKEFVRAQNKAAQAKVDLDEYYAGDEPGDSPGGPEGSQDS
jgi:terminase small subunit / prophage DNA-packing protein